MKYSPSTISKSRYRIWLTALVILSTFAALVIFKAGVPAVCTDCLSRLYFSMIWRIEPFLQKVTPWLPFHFIVYGSALKMKFPPFFTAHFLTALFSAGTLWLGAHLAYRLTHSTLAGLLAAALIATSPFHAWLSLSMLSEPLYNVLLLLFAHSLVNWLKSEKPQSLLVTIVFSFFLSATRFNGWPIALVAGMAVFFRRRSFGGAVATIGMWAMPLVWMALSWKNAGDPLWDLRNYIYESRAFYEKTFQPATALLLSFFKPFPGALPAILVGVFFPNFVGRKTWIFSLICLLHTAMEFGLVWNRFPTVYPERVFQASGLLTLIVSAIVLERCLQASSRLFPRLGHAAFGVLLLVHAVTLPTLQLQYDFELARIGRTLSRSPAWVKAVRHYPIATDLDFVPYLTVAVMSEHPESLIKLKYDCTEGKVLVHRSLRVRPKIFLLEASCLVDLIRPSLKHYVVIPIGRLNLLTDDPEIAREIRWEQSLGF